MKRDELISHFSSHLNGAGILKKNDSSIVLERNNPPGRTRVRPKHEYSFGDVTQLKGEGGLALDRWTLLMEDAPDSLWKAIFKAASLNSTHFEIDGDSLYISCREEALPSLLDRLTVLAALTADVHEQIYDLAVKKLKYRESIGG